MKIIRPETILDANVTATNVTEADQPEWASGTTYALNDLVMVTGTAGGAATATHKIYQSQAGSNTGNDPTTDDGTYWDEVSSTNAWKMFDAIVQDQTERSGGIEVTLTFTPVVNALAVINVDAASFTVVVDDATEGEVYNETYSLISDSGIQDWYAYFFEPIVRIDRYAITDLPPYAGSDITVTLTDTGTAKCGALVIGQFAELGQSQHGAGISITDYSTKTTDANGRVTITPGAYANRMDVDIILPTSTFPVVRNILTDIRTTPVVWIAQDDEPGAVVYGYYREFDIILSNPTLSRCSLDIEGLV